MEMRRIKADSLISNLRISGQSEVHKESINIFMHTNQFSMVKQLSFFPVDQNVFVLQKYRKKRKYIDIKKKTIQFILLQKQIINIHTNLNSNSTLL